MAPKDLKGELRKEGASPVLSSCRPFAPAPAPAPYEWKINRLQVVCHILLHLTAAYGLFYLFANGLWKLTLVHYITANLSLIGMGAGAHRLWSHRAYKAKLPLRILLAVFFAGAGQRDIFQWARDHRLHHKYSETDADPHNARRGFFFAHWGWLLVTEHPEVTKKERNVDLSDLLADPVVTFHMKYFLPLYVLILWLLPITISCALFGVPLFEGLAIACLRFAFVLHMTFLINSAAHLWGEKPYDTAINPGEVHSLAPLMLVGEMYHNFHHSFPNDYRASEYGWFFQWNLNAFFIDCMATIGLAYDLKTTSKDVVYLRKENNAKKAL